MNKVLLFLVALCVLPTAIQAQDVVTYDEFAQMDRGEQIRLFSEITPENRAQITKVQVNRYLEANRDQLSGDQIKTLESLLEKIQPSMYQPESAQASDQKAGEFMNELRAVFSVNQIAQCCGAGAPYIPPVNKE